MIVVVTEDPGTADAVVLLDELSAALQAITGSSGKASFDANDVRVENARFVVARNRDGQQVGCGAFRGIRVSGIRALGSVPTFGHELMHRAGGVPTATLRAPRTPRRPATSAPPGGSSPR